MKPRRNTIHRSKCFASNLRSSFLRLSCMFWGHWRVQLTRRSQKNGSWCSIQIRFFLMTAFSRNNWRTRSLSLPLSPSCFYFPALTSLLPPLSLSLPLSLFHETFRAHITPTLSLTRKLPVKGKRRQEHKHALTFSLTHSLSLSQFIPHTHTLLIFVSHILSLSFSFSLGR